MKWWLRVLWGDVLKGLGKVVRLVGWWGACFFPLAIPLGLMWLAVWFVEGDALQPSIAVIAGVGTLGLPVLMAIVESDYRIEHPREKHFGWLPHIQYYYRTKERVETLRHKAELQEQQQGEVSLAEGEA